MNPALQFLMWPFVSGIILFLIRREKWAQWANLAFALVWVALFFAQLLPAWRVHGSDSSFPILFSWNWLPFLRSRFSLGVDGLSLGLIGLNVLLAVSLAFYSIGKEKLGSGYLGFLSLLNAASVGSLMAADAVAFYVFWEFMLIPLFILIGKWGSKNRVYAAMKFFVFTMTGSLLMLFSILGLAYASDVASLGWHDLVAADFSFVEGWGSLQGLLFLGFLAAFIVKIPVWPLHSWLPDAHTEAPTGGSVILAGVLLKLGVYGIARWCLPVFPEAAVAASFPMMVLAVAGIVIGALAAWKQTDIKRMIAYSSVSHLGFMALGLFSLNQEGLHGAMFQNIAHGLSTGAMFLMFGMIYDRTHTRELKNYGGLASRSGLLASAFVLASMASVGLPGLAGFIGEFLVLTGAFLSENRVFAFIALAGVLLGAVYTLALVRKLVFGPVSPLIEQHPIRLSWNEWAALMPLLFLLVYLGLQPQIFFNLTQSAVNTALQAR